jgi:hypothetical protein
MPVTWMLPVPGQSFSLPCAQSRVRRNGFGSRVHRVRRAARRGRGYRTQTKVELQGGHEVAIVTVGVQKLLFRETDAPMPPYDGYHIAIYIANHSDPHRFLQEHNVRVEESNAHQYRFWDIIDPDTGRELFTLEHEVRSMRHPQFDKPLLNRNPDQANNNEGRGYDAFRGIY